MNKNALIAGSVIISALLFLNFLKITQLYSNNSSLVVQEQTFLHESLQAGKIPLWNLVKSRPMLSKEPSWIFYPPNVLLSLFLRPVESLIIEILISVLISVLFFYVLINRKSKLEKMFSALFLSLLGLLWHDISACQATPLMLLALMLCKKAVNNKKVLPIIFLSVSLIASTGNLALFVTMFSISVLLLYRKGIVFKQAFFSFLIASPFLLAPFYGFAVEQVPQFFLSQITKTGFLINLMLFAALLVAKQFSGRKEFILTAIILAIVITVFFPFIPLDEGVSGSKTINLASEHDLVVEEIGQDFAKGKITLNENVLVQKPGFLEIVSDGEVSRRNGWTLEIDGVLVYKWVWDQDRYVFSPKIIKKGEYDFHLFYDSLLPGLAFQLSLISLALLFFPISLKKKEILLFLVFLLVQTQLFSTMFSENELFKDRPEENYLIQLLESPSFKPFKTRYNTHGNYFFPTMSYFSKELGSQKMMNALPYLFATLTSVIIFLMRKNFGSFPIWAALVLNLRNRLLIGYSYRISMDFHIMSFFFVLALFSLIKFQEKKRWLYACLLGLATGFGLMNHFGALMFFLPLALSYAVIFRRRILSKKMLLSLLVFCAIVIPNFQTFGNFLESMNGRYLALTAETSQQGLPNINLFNPMQTCYYCSVLSRRVLFAISFIILTWSFLKVKDNNSRLVILSVVIFSLFVPCYETYTISLIPLWNLSVAIASFSLMKMGWSKVRKKLRAPFRISKKEVNNLLDASIYTVLVMIVWLVVQNFVPIQENQLTEPIHLCKDYSNFFTHSDDSQAIRFEECNGPINNSAYIVMCNKGTCRTFFKLGAKHEWINFSNKKSAILDFYYKGNLSSVSLLKKDDGTEIIEEKFLGYNLFWTGKHFEFSVQNASQISIQFTSSSDGEDTVEYALSGVKIETI